MTFYDILEDQVSGETSEDVSYRTLHTNLKIQDQSSLITINIPYESIIDKYKDYLKGIITTLKLDSIQQAYFRYNPHALSDKIYGTPLLWSVLLELNNCTSRFEFDMSNIKYYEPNELMRYISDIMIKEEELKY